MTLLRISNRQPRWLQAGVLLCVMIVLPLGFASAADLEAVERKLGEAVADGDLSLDEAKLMLDTLKKATDPKKEHDKKHVYTKEGQAHYFDATWKKLQAMVKAGQITEKYAHEKMAAMKKGAAAKGAYDKYGKGPKSDGDERLQKFRANEVEIHKAVRAGRMSKEDAARKLEALKKEIFSEKYPEKAGKGGKDGKDGGDERARKFREIEIEIWSAVKAGKMSKEDAVRKLGELKNQIFEGKYPDKGGKGAKSAKGNEDERLRKFKEIEAKIYEAVKAGKMSKEDADEKLSAIKNELFGK